MTNTNKREHQTAEGALIERARQLRGLKARAAARDAGMSDARWRQIESGYASVGPGQVIPVRGPDETVARMASVVGVTAEQLREAGRAAAADVLLTLVGMQAESEWQSVGTALDRLRRIRDEIDSVIGELAAAPATPAPSPSRPRPEIEVGDEDA